MFIRAFYTPGLAINSYLVADLTTHRAVVIDPTREIKEYLQCAQQEGFTITHITETHVHADFISGSKELKAALKGKAEICCSVAGGQEWLPQYTDKAISTGDEINLGSVRLQALHTPGHTPEHLVWLCFDESRSRGTPCLAFTGDALFVGSVGRPDLLGKEETQALAQQLYHTLFEVMKSLPDFLEIYPGHGAGSLCGKALSPRATSTLGYERLFNPFFKKLPLEEWIETLLSNMSAPPINFQRIKKMNVQGSASNPKNKEPLVIDLRHPEEYAKGHLRHSINIPLGASFCNWVGAVIGEDTLLGLVAQAPQHLSEAIKGLRLIGLDDIAFQWVWDAKNIPQQYTVESFPLVSVQEVAEKIRIKDPSLYILDVRTPAEWEAGHIAQAHHLEITQCARRLSEVPKDKEVHVICGSGYRASIIASLLKKNGFPRVANIKGGMHAWTAHKA